MDIYKVLGVMSGTSLDGLDLAYCEFIKGETWTCRILEAITIPYTTEKKEELKKATSLSGLELTAFNASLGKFIGEECRKFIGEKGLQPGLIASHGHTVFHQPEKGFTLQAGSGAHIFAATHIPVVCDFRLQDVALGGQGAPLVPIGDLLLFSEYDACLNLGGFANISAQKDHKRTAWDICAVNTVLNRYAGEAGYDFDENGSLSRKGKLHQPLLDELKQLEFYMAPPPKSLGMEWVEAVVFPVVQKYAIAPEDILHTYVLHIAEVIGKTIQNIGTGTGKVLVTGGGAYHRFLVEKIKENTTHTIVIPDDATIQYKEALIFGLLGVLKWRGEVNILSSVTGAREDHSSGIIYGR